jgi:hypothetical protein
MTYANAMRWTRDPGFYEVWYLTLTDRASGVGLWIRYTLLAPRLTTGEPATCSLWFLAMQPGHPPLGRKADHPIEALRAESNPFELRVGDATLSDHGAQGAFDDVSWDLEWQPAARAYEHVHPLLQRTKIAKTVLTLPHADLGISGRVSFGERTLELDDVRGGQAHLWGTKHASAWAWVHCNDLETLDGERRPGAFVDGVSVLVPRFGREVGPSTPLVGRVGGRDFLSTSPARVLTNASRFALTGWTFTVRDGYRRLVGEVDAARESLAGVTYHDPDGDLAYCYNTEIATLRLQSWEGETLRETLTAPGRAHFEYAQRQPIPDVPLLTS